MSVDSNQFAAELIARMRHRREFFARQVLAAEKLSGAAVMADKMQLPKLVKTALDETRMLVLGAQILLGFELSGIFRDGFETLPMHARYLDGIALLLMIITVAFLVTPESYHQIVEVGADTYRALPPVDIAHGRFLVAAVRAQFGNSPFYHWRIVFSDSRLASPPAAFSPFSP